MSWVLKYRDNLRVWLVVALLAALVMPLVPSQQVYAKDPPKKKVEIESLSVNEIRLNQHTKAQRKDTFKDKGKLWERWEATVSSLPQTLGDLKTKITVEWREGQSSDGITYYETGNNVFYARITRTRVSVEGEGKLAAWDPILYLNANTLELRKGPTLVKDIYNSNFYGYNTISWVYVRAGNLLNPEVTVIRYIRQIEGSLQEFYVFGKDPNATFTVINKYKSEKGFKWSGKPTAWDSRGTPLKVVGNEQEKVVDSREFGRRGIKYPVFVDPTTTFTGSYKDAWLDNTEETYAAARGAASADSVGGTVYLGVGQSTFAPEYSVSRSFVFFDTSALPDTAIISAAQLKLYSDSKLYDVTYTAALQIQSGMPTYPSDPVVASDFSQVLYSGLGLIDAQWFDYITTGAYNIFTLSASGLSWVSKTGWTKLMLRSTQDINNVAPSAFHKVYFLASEVGAGTAPQLVVTYTTPVTIPVIDTRTANLIGGTYATLRGYLVDDGGATSSVWFDYGTTTSYGTSLSPMDGYTTGQSWERFVPGLQYGTLYHYTARAQNIAGISVEDDQTFLTLPDRPTGFGATPGNQQNSLSWTKGTGSTNTMIRRDTTGYPTTVASGTQVYFSTGTSVVDTGRTNGVTYYYSAWAEKTDSGWQQYSANYATVSGMPYVAGPPAPVTFDAINTTQNSAILVGYLDSLGGYASADVWFQYYWGAGSWTDNETTPETMTSTGLFNAQVGGLPASTTVHVRAAATGTGGTAYGNDMPFLTGATSAPTIQTVSYSGITGDGATLYGKVVSDGGAPVTARFDWGLTTSYGQQTGTASGLLTGDSFNVVLTGLTLGTAYNFRAVGWNSAGTGYGTNIQFTTLSPSAPTATALSATEVGSTSAMLHGQLDTDGGVGTDVRFQWSNNATLAVNITASGWQTGKRTGDTFNYFATNMTILTTYYFRVQAQNAGGSVNSTILNFTTVFVAPTNFAATPQSSTSIALSWVSQGDKTQIIARTGSYPADRLDGEQAYFGPNSSATYENRLPGTTYYFRAWSWREGGIFSSSYAEDAATTTSGVRVGSITYPVINNTAPGVPSWWWGTPPEIQASSKIQKWPGVGLVDNVASDMGMPSNTMWWIVGGLFTVLIAVAAASILPLPISVVVSGGITILIFSFMGILAGWMLVMYILIGGGYLYMSKSGGM